MRHSSSHTSQRPDCRSGLESILGQCVLGLWGLRCHDTASLEILSTQPVAWRATALVSHGRYCTHTVLTLIASSAAMHIQCSDDTYKLLNKLGGFTLENRGVIEVKVSVNVASGSLQCPTSPSLVQGKGAMNTWWLKGYTEPEREVLPPCREETSSSPTTKEPIRDAPKKISNVAVMGGRSLDVSGSTSSLSRGVSSRSSTALDVYKRQGLHSSSASNLLSIEEGEKTGRDKMVTPKRSITMPREAMSSGLASEQSRPAAKPAPPAVRHSVPHIKVNTFSLGSRRLTQPNMESVGLGSAAVREGAERKMSRTSITSREHTTQLSVSPLDGQQNTKL